MKRYDFDEYHNKVARFDCLVMMASSLFSSAFFLFLGLFALHVNNGDNWLTQVSIVMSIIGMVGFVFCFATYGTRFWK
jgi:heme/copper-type cytochrome/quinol oxidase subunit 3|tara:strand:+ start:595 stop:828 length:234 start_codon:yes stop_codon:yes gene_type:complete